MDNIVQNNREIYETCHGYMVNVLSSNPNKSSPMYH